MTFKVTKIPGLGSYGQYIDGVDLASITHNEWMEIGRLHLKSLVTVIRQPNCTKDRFSELINKFGDPRGTVYITQKYLKRYKKNWDWIAEQFKQDSDLLDAEDKEIIRITASSTENTASGIPIARVAGGYNDQGLPNGWFAEGELDWHSNESGQRTLTPGIGFLAYKNVVGSATGFLTTPDYYENVSNSFRSELDDMIVIHNFTPGKMNPGLRADQDRAMKLNMCPDPDSEVPLVMQSPGGIKGLHYSVGTISSIKGMSQLESNRVFSEINKGLIQDKYIYDHWYQQDGDLLLFDNSITLHRRLGNIDGRVAYRIAHDYTNLQDGVWAPYYQPEYAELYRREIREVIKIAKIKNFKLPPWRFRDLFDV